MRLKRLLLVLLVVLCASLLFGGDWKYQFWNLDQHPEILGGFLPTYIGMGVDYDGLHFIPERTTTLELLAGGGYYQQKMWSNPATGLQLAKGDEALIYDVMEFEWRLRFSQGFGASKVEGQDLWTVYAQYEGYYSQTYDSMVKGKERTNNGATKTVSGISDWFANYGAPTVDNQYYPDLGQMLGTDLIAGVKFSQMDDQLDTQDGFLSELTVDYAPLALNSALQGKANYYSITSNNVGAFTLYSLRDSKDKNLFSIVIADRVNANWTDGSKVSMRQQHPVSLGRKVRGFKSWSYATQFTIVNNFDIRFCGPSLYFKKVQPRINIFCDVGYGCGNRLNTDSYESNFLSSAGIQATVSFFDFIDLGLQYSYLFTGTNFAKYGDNFIMEFTFFLDF